MRYTIKFEWRWFQLHDINRYNNGQRMHEWCRSNLLHIYFFIRSLNRRSCPVPLVTLEAVDIPINIKRDYLFRYMTINHRITVILNYYFFTTQRTLTGLLNFHCTDSHLSRWIHMRSLLFYQMICRHNISLPRVPKRRRAEVAWY